MVMNKNHLEVMVEDERWKTAENCQSKARLIFDTALTYIDQNDLSPVIGFDKPIEINLALSNNNEVHRLNAEFRGMDKPTNVLSFANIDDEEFLDELDTAETVELGDIIVALETLQSEASQKNIPLENHFAHLLVHGILHLFGYDHQTDSDADEMEGIEIKILALLGIPNPYTE